MYDKYLPVLRAIGDQPLYVGPIGAGTVAKLAHNCASFAMQAALAEIFTLGVKAGVEPLALFRAMRQGASGRKRTFDRLAEHFLPGKFDPPIFSLRLAHKDVVLALELAREVGVPMQFSELALDELDARHRARLDRPRLPRRDDAAGRARRRERARAGPGAQEGARRIARHRRLAQLARPDTPLAARGALGLAE